MSPTSMRKGADGVQFGLKFAFQPIRIPKSPPPHPTGGGGDVTWTSVRCTFGPKLVFQPHETPKSTPLR